MDLDLLLGLLQAAAQLTPIIANVLPSVENLINGSATPEDIGKLEAARDALNAMAENAEQRVIDAGDPPAPLA